MTAAIEEAIRKLSPFEAWVIRERYGAPGRLCTYFELGRDCGLSVRRIHQIEREALN
jgi:DNA-directed RNA polymerase sigma subunit (sigma70/sigma32)